MEKWDKTCAKMLPKLKKFKEFGHAASILKSAFEGMKS